MKLYPSTINELVEILVPLVNGDIKRQSLLIAALGIGAPVLQQIDYSGAPLEFIIHLLTVLAQYGEVTAGKQALVALLEYVQTQVGLDVQQRIDKLFDKLNEQSTSLPQSPSLAETEYRKVVEKVASDGKVSVAGRYLLEQSKKNTGISQEKAEKIEKEVLQPFYEYQKRFDEFRQVLVEQSQKELPFSKTTRSDLATLYSQLKIAEVEELYIKLAKAFYKSNELRKSIDVYREVILLNPNNAITHQNLAYILLQCEQLDDAITEYREAIRIEPNNVKLYLVLGNIFDFKAEFDKAIETYQQAIKVNINDASNDLAEIHYLLGCTFSRYERLENAIAEHRQAIQINPQYAEAYAELGKCQNWVENFVDAARNLRKAIALKPDNSEFHYYLGIVLNSQAKSKEAIVEFEEAINLNIINSTPNPIAYTHYAFALLSQNKQKKAEDEIGLAIELFQKQDMGDAAKQMEQLFEQIKQEGSWKSFFKQFFKFSF
ncbi:tetratricopeptide repeat protein [Iningainema tapete]|uniref:Tetratricopeptide repeat protein n=1 Tax=Iningainema tapete BLCC-T55 TaxID=2748662 RepID=A0A8J7CH79_9CYAN|nr:tetratricopeptide repeat protein [Iningainema tapete]MBD2777315.1 tetratricopeptide repeat protein [Iningainema tapete BLCC-T55]